ncbi:hypothetical protein KM043_002192 [Ampulex compressa]|nr:hypothetical protein KM043_002192 [Ampulex compressa]
MTSGRGAQEERVRLPPWLPFMGWQEIIWTDIVVGVIRTPHCRCPFSCQPPTRQPGVRQLLGIPGRVTCGNRCGPFRLTILSNSDSRSFASAGLEIKARVNGLSECLTMRYWELELYILFFLCNGR